MSTTEVTEQSSAEEQKHRRRILEQVAAIRALADFAEEQADRFPDYVLSHDFAAFVDGAEEMVRLAASLGGQWQKRTTDSVYALEREFGGSSEYTRVKLSINTMRHNVCERVQVGTETRMVPDPQLVEEIPLVPVEEPVYEWRCPDSLLDVRDEDFTGPAPENPEPSPW